MDWRDEVTKNRSHVTDEVAFCEEMMNRLFNSVYENVSWKKDQVRADIIRLRRELNTLRQFMDDNDCVMI